MLDNEPRLRNHTEIIVNNLRSNRYGRFIERPNIMEEIKSALTNDDIIILVYGQGGIGKSAMVYNTVARIIDHKLDLNVKIDKVFWFSDADAPGNLTLNDIISEIKTTCNISDSTRVQPSLESNLRDVRNAFDNTKLSIIVIDNLETIEDQQIWDFILKDGPRKCKFILTSKYNIGYYKTNKIKNKNYIRELDNCVTLINIPKVSIDEWRTIFEKRKNDNKVLARWSNSIGEANLDEVLKLVYNNMDGNVYGMISAISILAKRAVPFGSIGNVLNGELLIKDAYDRIIKNAWEMLSEQAQSVLVAAVLNGPEKLDFPLIYSYCRIGEVNGDSVEIESDLDNAINECEDLSLIDRDYENSNMFKYINPFVYHFVIYKIKHDDNAQFDTIINRWIDSYVQLSKNIGFCYNKTEKMLQLDPPVKRNSLLFVLDYCYERKNHWQDYIIISGNLRYYFYTRAIWEQGDNCIHIKRANLAHKIGQLEEEFSALTYYINIASKYHEIETVDRYIIRAEEIIKACNIDDESIFRFKHAKGLYYYASNNYEKALELWDSILTEEAITDNTHDRDAAERWRLKCKYKLFSDNPVIISEEIIPKCEKFLAKAKKKKMVRSAVDYTLVIVEANISLNNYEEALKHLTTIEDDVLKLNDKLYIARFYLFFALCKKDEDAGKEYIRKSAEHYASLNILHELDYLNLKITGITDFKQIVSDVLEKRK